MPPRPNAPQPTASGTSPLSRIILELRESISIRSEDGLYFGEIMRFGGGRMEIECDGHFELRAELEFQLKLPTFNATVYGIARVLRAISRTALLRQYTLRIQRMRAKDRLLLQQWVDYSARGPGGDPSGTRASEAAYDSATDPNPWGIADLDAEAQTQAGKLALRDAMRARFQPSSAGTRSGPRETSGGPLPRPGAPLPPTGPAPYDRSDSPTQGARADALAGDGDRSPATPIDSSGAGPRQGGAARSRPSAREAVGEAIDRAQAGARGRRRGEPEVSDQEGSKERNAAARPSQRQRRSMRRPPLVEVESARSPKLPSPKDPQVHMRLSTDPPQIFVRYNTRSGYFSDYQSYLSKNVLFLQNTEVTPRKGAMVQLSVFLPAGLSLTCEALVIATLPNGFGLSLQLDNENRLVLASASHI